MTRQMQSSVGGDDTETERRILSKVTWRLMPALLIGLFISYVDRANLGVLFKPMAADLGLSATTFGLAAGLFYVGYLIFEIPSNMAMTRFGARLWISRIMITWGIVVMATAFTHSHTSLYALRILLGVAEAGFFPGVLLYLTFWYPPHALPRAYSLLEIGIPVSLALASALTSTMLGIDGLMGISGWRWVFLLQGAPAVLLGLYVLVLLPDRPATASWLTSEEKAFLETRVTTKQAAARSEAAMLPQVLASGMSWLLTVIYFSMVIGFWAITYFLPQIVQERFQVTNIAAGFISAIPWLVAALAIYVFAKTSERTGDRQWHMFCLLALAGIGLAVSAYTNSPILALIGICLGAAGMQASVPLFWSMPSATFTAATTAIAIAMINSLGNISGLVGPWVLGFFQDLTGSSRTGLYLMSVFFFFAAVLAAATSRHITRTYGR